jgi:hypothetical protein
LFLFDLLKDLYHIVGMDNLFVSLKFARQAFAGKNKVMIHGVARVTGRGIPPCVVIEKIKNKKQAALVRGTTKAAVLKGDPDCPDVVAFSIYDTVPVHFLTTSCQSLKWKEKAKRVYNPTEGACIAMKFLRPEISDTYNNGMNKVDIADQMRGHYRWDKWMRKRKWWWSIWMWAMQVLLVNSYILYRSAYLYIWKKDKKEVMSQYEFRKQIILNWLDAESLTLNNKPQKRKHDSISSITSAVSGLTQDTEVSTKKATRFNDTTLDPSTGALKMRLDSNYHYIIPSRSKNSCCGLCRWAQATGQNNRNKRIRGNTVGECDFCRVALCMSCFKLFHTVGPVNKLKSEILKRQEEEEK